ncbi:MAG: energy-coupling factor ABC transporter permease [FCB group bacterium]|jgi:cobalt/nickel transport system permease protein|nr:energy-coupling factor ABC transporter permease [FCB group bacterium]
MHLMDGLVSGPVAVAAFAGSAAVCALALSRAEKNLGERQIPLLAVTASFVFAAQMLNFPVAAGTSGHFMGAALAAILLGPLNGVLVMALVLTIQCLAFGDGGITALGANVLNMGVVGAMGAYGVFRGLRWVLSDTRGGFLGAASVASWTSPVLASAACAFELSLSGTYPFFATLPAMTGVHAVIGIGEALITCVTLSAVLASRPDLVPGMMPAAQEA